VIACSDLFSLMIFRKIFYVSKVQNSVVLASPLGRPISYEVLEMTE